MRKNIASLERKKKRGKIKCIIIINYQNMHGICTVR